MTALQRDLKQVLRIGAGSTLGLAGLLWFNWWLWGEVSVTGGYGSGFTGRFLDPEAMGFAENVVRAFVDPTHGLIVFSPFLLVLVPGLRRAWRATPAWAKGAAIGGALYLLIQFKANRFSGGDGFTGYRYPLEALTAVAMLLFLAYRWWVAKRPMMVRLFWACVGAAVVFQLT